MDFFKNKIVKIVAWVLLTLSVVVLVIGGATTETISSGVVLVAGIVAAVSALIAFIVEQVSKKEAKKE